MGSHPRPTSLTWEISPNTATFWQRSWARPRQASLDGYTIDLMHILGKNWTEIVFSIVNNARKNDREEVMLFMVNAPCLGMWQSLAWLTGWLWVMYEAHVMRPMLGHLYPRDVGTDLDHASCLYIL